MHPSPTPPDSDPLALAVRLKASFGAGLDAPLEAFQALVARCQPVAFGKHTILKASGLAEPHGYFILSGSAGVFAARKRDDVCLDIVFENDFFADHLSLITGEPTLLYTMTLEATTMLRLARADVLWLKQTPVGLRLFLLGAEQSFVQKQRQQADLLLKTAEQRYRELVQREPRLSERTAQRHLASYLGITTQSLSRIRARLAQRR